MIKAYRGKALFFGASALALVAAGGAQAQTAAAAAAEESTLETIVVTGSRLQAGFSAPTPVTVLGTAEVQSKAPASVFDVVRDIPSFRATTGPNAQGYGIVAANQATLNLRGLGDSRTLVLVDGRRRTGTEEGGVYDTNHIPSSLIERTEVVTGGASAAYGSDAVAGVVNFILDTDFEGLKGNFQYGQTFEGDAQEKLAAGAYGRRFGRAHFVIGAEYAEGEGTDPFWKARDWGRREPGIITLGATRPAGVPQNILAEWVEVSSYTPGGLIDSGPLRGTAFGPGGTPYQFQYGTFVGALQQYAGPNSPNYGNVYYRNFQIRAPYERGAVLANLTYDFTDSIRGFARVSHGRFNSHATTIEVPQPMVFTVNRDNPFLPTSVRDRMIANNLTTVQVRRVGTDVGPLTSGNKIRTLQLDFGLEGEFNLGTDWRWDLGYSYGDSDLSLKMHNTPREADLYASAYAVRNPVTGRTECGPVATNPYWLAQNAERQALLTRNLSPGCVPYNFFGPEGNKDAIAYFNSTAGRETKLEQSNAMANIAGEPFELPAGPVSFAAGLEWRNLKTSSDGCVDCKKLALVNQNFVTWGGDVTVKEGYAEIGIPVIRDAPFFTSLDLNGAVRRTHYSTSGWVTTWKAGFTYEPTDFLRIRATQSHDIRAANAQELFLPPVVGSGGGNILVNRVTGRSNFTRSSTGGNPNLKPEIGDTTTAGVIFQPSFIPGFRAAVDYFHIIITDQIAAVGAQDVVDRLLAGQQEYAPFVIFDASAPNGIGFVISTQANQAAQKMHGFDFELAYAVPIDRLGLPGNLTVRSLATHVQSLRQIQGANDTENLGVLVPKWSVVTTFGYNVGRFTSNLTARYTSHFKYSATLIGPDDPRYNPAANNTINRNIWPESMLWNLYAAYELIDSPDRSLQVYGTMDNIFDKDPPIVAQVSLNAANGYDFAGRRFKVGLRFRY